MPHPSDLRVTRRTFLHGAALTGATAAAPGWLARPAAAQPSEGARARRCRTACRAGTLAIIPRSCGAPPTGRPA